MTHSSKTPDSLSHSVQRQIFFISFLLLSFNSFSCDSCGGSGGGIGGLTPVFGNNLLGIRYRYSGVPKHHHGHSLDTTNLVNAFTFKSLDLWGRWQLKSRFIFIASLPFQENSMQQADVLEALRGRGDAQGQIWYAVLQADSNSCRPVQNNLIIGFGLHVPGARFMSRNKQKVLYPAPMQLGTGAFRQSFMLQHIMQFSSWGAVTTYSYRRNSENELGYKFGSINQMFTCLFKKVELGSNRLIPQIGFMYEYTSQDRQYGLYKNETGAELSLLHLAMEWYRKKWLLGFNMQQSLKAGSAGLTERRYTLQAAYSF